MKYYVDGAKILRQCYHFALKFSALQYDLYLCISALQKRPCVCYHFGSGCCNIAIKMSSNTAQDLFFAFVFFALKQSMSA